MSREHKRIMLLLQRAADKLNLVLTVLCFFFFLFDNFKAFNSYLPSSRSPQVVHNIAESEKYFLDSAAEYGNKASNLDSSDESGVYEGEVTCLIFFFNNYDHVCLFDFLTLYKLTSVYVGVSWCLQCQEAAKKYANMRHVSLRVVCGFSFFTSS